jgi:ubiquinone biosynthesis UbiH/UbiF/VisC/COQ6 family hydroxylase|tara:strand:- start:848 stop:1987 length:1140 start_codon:yes stop_codon:yes gene_type:complete
MVSDIQNSIIIIGGGLVGNLLHLMLESKGFSINQFEKTSKLKNRTFALTPSSVDWLKSLGLPSKFFDSLNDISSMKIFDSTLSNSVTFESDDIAKPAIAFMANEKDFNEAIEKTFKKRKTIEEIPKDYVIKNKQDQVIIETSKERYKSSIIIACDGVNSLAREKIEIKSTKHDFNQTAITFQLKVKLDNQNEAKQFFLKESILAILPIKKDLVSIVWSCNSQFYKKINSFDEKSIEDELNLTIGDFYKDIKVVSKIESFPLTMNRVESFFKDRVLLVGDAAHFIHPLAGQGLNLGIRDIITLEKIIDKKGYADIGLKGFLRKYERARKEDVAQMGFLTLGLNWIFSNKSSILSRIVGKGMSMLDKSKLLKKQLIKKATA